MARTDPIAQALANANDWRVKDIAKQLDVPISVLEHWRKPRGTSDLAPWVRRELEQALGLNAKADKSEAVTR